MGKKVKSWWKHQTFAKQISITFVLICMIQTLILFGISSKYFTDVVRDKILSFFQLTVQQAALNTSATLKGYEDAINQMIIDEIFLENVFEYQLAEGKNEQRIKRNLKDEMHTFMTYRPMVRGMSIETENKKKFSIDRLLIDSIYQKTPELHEKYFRELDEKKKELGKGEWLEAKYYDEQGTYKYYLFTYRRRLFDWYTTQYVGSFLMSIDEAVLQKICKEAQITDDTENNENFIINLDGKIVSHWNKRMLGKDLQQNQEWNYILKSKDRMPIKANIDGKKAFVIIQDIQDTNWKMVSILKYNYISSEIQGFQKSVLLIAVLLSILEIIAIALVSKHVSKAAEEVVSTMREVREGELSATISIDNEERNEIAIIAKQFNKMMEKINQQVEEIKIAFKKEKNAEIRALEAQINPHFIYNTLDSINWLAIEGEQEQISEMLSEFALILRYQISKSNVMVPIAEEIEYLRKYLFLQKIRFMDNFEYVIECEESILNYKIYKMIFQPFIENCIVHGYANIQRGGFLKVTVTNTEQGKIRFSILDNGNGISSEKIEEIFVRHDVDTGSIGVQNVLARLDMYYGKNYELNVKSQMGKWTIVEIMIPKIEV